MKKYFTNCQLEGTPQAKVTSVLKNGACTATVISGKDTGLDKVMFTADISSLPKRGDIIILQSIQRTGGGGSGLF
ncbi:MAG: hypothetical protein AAB438_01145 [Patescibacteria group bacterium]